MFDIDNTVFLHQQAILKELLAEKFAYLSLVLCVLKNCDDFPISHDPPPPLFQDCHKVIVLQAWSYKQTVNLSSGRCTLIW